MFTCRPQEALDNVSPGDTIFLEEGSYWEDLTTKVSDLLQIVGCISVPTVRAELMCSMIHRNIKHLATTCIAGRCECLVKANLSGENLLCMRRTWIEKMIKAGDMHTRWYRIHTEPLNELSVSTSKLSALEAPETLRVSTWKTRTLRFSSLALGAIECISLVACRRLPCESRKKSTDTPNLRYTWRAFSYLFT